MTAFEPPERFNIAEHFLDARVREGAGEREALRLDAGSWSYREVQALADRAGRALTRLGVRPGERVLIALPDGPEFVAALFGTLKIGAVVVMVNPDLKPESLATLYDYTWASRAVVGGPALPAFAEARERAEWKPELLAVGEGDGAESWPLWEQEVVGGGEAAALEALRTHRDDAAIWLFSGGTTGAPKGVVQTHASFANTTELYARAALGYSAGDVTMSVPKLFFGYATGSNLLFPFSVGAAAVLFPEHPTPEVVFEKIRRHRPTILINVPKMVAAMVSHPQAASQDLSCLRLATSAGEALPAPLYQRWKETFGVELLDGLGTAEMWHIFVSNLPGAVRPGTLGRVVPGFEIKVCDEEGRELPDGEVGRMWVRGGSRALGYWRDAAKTAEAFRGEWFVGGDLVRRDADGYFTYCGRGDDVLKVGGKWVAPQEVESCLARHPSVAECAVVGVENDAGLTEPWAFVVPAGRGARGEEIATGDDLATALQRHCLDHLEPHKHPRRVVLLEEMPRTHLGKVDRGALRRSA